MVLFLAKTPGKSITQKFCLTVFPAFCWLLMSSAAQATQYLSIAQAQAQLFPSATSFQAVMPAVSPANVQAINQAAGLTGNLPIRTTWRAMKQNTALGWVVADHVIGKHDYIDFAVAISPDGKVAGFEVLTYRETYGGQVRSPAWRSQFIGKQAQDPVVAGQDISVISGATLSSAHLAQAVKRILAYWQLVLRT